MPRPTETVPDEASLFLGPRYHPPEQILVDGDVSGNITKIILSSKKFFFSIPLDLENKILNFLIQKSTK